MRKIGEVTLFAILVSVATAWTLYELITMTVEQRRKAEERRQARFEQAWIEVIFGGP